MLCTVGCYAAAKKEEEEHKAQKRSSQASSPQQQQGDEIHPTSSSDQPKAASTSSSVAGSISLAAWSHQGIAEKAKEVVPSYMPCFRFFRLVIFPFRLHLLEAFAFDLHRPRCYLLLLSGF